MKKILLLFLSLMVMFLLVGCGGSDSGPSHIKVVKDGNTFKYERGSSVFTVNLKTYKTNNPLYQVIDFDENIDSKYEKKPFTYVQNLLTGDIYFANLIKDGEIYDIEGELYGAFLNDMYLGYKKVYTNVTLDGNNISTLTVEVGSATDTITTLDGKVHTVYPVTYTFASSKSDNTLTHYWAKDLGWYFLGKLA